MSKKDDYSERQTNGARGGLRLNGVALAISIIFFLAAILGALWMALEATAIWIIGIYVAACILIGVYILVALNIASQWDKAVVLRFGKFHRLAGPGLFIG